MLKRSLLTQINKTKHINKIKWHKGQNKWSTQNTHRHKQDMDMYLNTVQHHSNTNLHTNINSKLISTPVNTYFIHLWPRVLTGRNVAPSLPTQYSPHKHTPTRAVARLSHCHRVSQLSPLRYPTPLQCSATKHNILHLTLREPLGFLKEVLSQAYF